MEPTWRPTLPATFLTKAVGGGLALARCRAGFARRLFVGGRLLLRRGPLAGALHQLLIGRVTIDRLVILAIDRRRFDELVALLRRDRSHAAFRRADHGALDHRRHALEIEYRNQRLALAELSDRFVGLEFGVRTEGVGRRLYRLLLAWRISAQRMLGRGCPSAPARFPAHRADSGSRNRHPPLWSG